MKIKIRGETAEIEGYVNAIERNSRTLIGRIGEFIERVCRGAFKKALRRNDNVRILLNHNWQRDLGGTADGNLELEEDAIGLRFHATIADAEVIEKARAGDIIGCSFGFQDRDVETSVENGKVLRLIRDLDLREVSLIDRRMKPAYEGTLVSVRADEDGEEQIHFRAETFCTEVEVSEETQGESTKTEVRGDAVEKTVEKSMENIDKIDYTKYRNIINEMKGVK